jgi:hypothetical protein
MPTTSSDDDWDDDWDEALLMNVENNYREKRIEQLKNLYLKRLIKSKTRRT